MPYSSLPFSIASPIFFQSPKNSLALGNQIRLFHTWDVTFKHHNHHFQGKFLHSQNDAPSKRSNGAPVKSPDAIPTTRWPSLNVVHRGLKPSRKLLVFRVSNREFHGLEGWNQIKETLYRMFQEKEKLGKMVSKTKVIFWVVYIIWVKQLT